MKHLIGVLYLVTGLVGFAWAWYTHAMALYGAPFTWLNVILYAGSLLLIFAAILWWVTHRRWTRWLPLAGSGVLAVYFLPAFITNLPDYVAGIRYQPTWTIIGLSSVALVVASLAVAITRALSPARPAPRG
jgi:hypothetical protein